MERTDEVTAELGRNATNKFANKSGMRGNMAKPTAIMAMSTMSKFMNVLMMVKM